MVVRREGGRDGEIGLSSREGETEEGVRGGINKMEVRMWKRSL